MPFSEFRIPENGWNAAQNEVFSLINQFLSLIAVQCREPENVSLFSGSLHNALESIVQDKPTEIEFRDIEGWLGYRVGSDGSIWTQWRKMPGWKHRMERVEEWRIHRSHLCHGYPSVSLRSEFKKSKGIKVHRIVLEAFVGPRPDGLECCHNDGNPRNNAISNLRWDTQASNHADKIKHGRIPKGEDCWNAKLTWSDVRMIRKLADEGVNFANIAEGMGLPRCQVIRVVRRKSYKDEPPI